MFRRSSASTSTALHAIAGPGTSSATTRPYSTARGITVSHTSGWRLRRQLSRRGRHQLWAYVFLLPMVALLMVFKAAPIIQALLLSMTSYDLITPPRFNGLSNYLFLITDSRFLGAVRVTLYYMFGTAIPLWILSLGLAVAFNQRFPARNWIRLAYFLPTIVPLVVFGTVWQFLFHPYGLVNQGLQALHLPPVLWLTNSSAVIPGFILATEWRFVPYFMIIYLAGLQNIPVELKEAAAIDGGSKWQVFWHITLPLLRPTILLVVVISLILLSRSFTVAYVMTGGGPNNASTVIGLYIYKAAFSEYRMGIASAASILLLLGTMVLTLIQLRVFRDGRNV
jgi:ABC-type sugar transport system permease subunit